MRSRKASTEWIDPAIAAVSPDYATARQRLQKATQARDIVVNGANSLPRGFKNGQRPALL